MICRAPVRERVGVNAKEALISFELISVSLEVAYFVQNDAEAYPRPSAKASQSCR